MKTVRFFACVTALALALGSAGLQAQAPVTAQPAPAATGSGSTATGQPAPGAQSTTNRTPDSQPAQAASRAGAASESDPTGSRGAGLPMIALLLGAFVLVGLVAYLRRPGRTTRSEARPGGDAARR